MRRLNTRCLPRSFRPILPFLLVIAFILTTPTPTLAHPLGNFTVNRYSRLEVASQQITLYYIVDMAEIPAFQERAYIDADQDEIISQAEQARYLTDQVTALQRNLHLSVGDLALNLAPQAQSLTFPPGQGGLLTLRLEIRFAATLPQGQGLIGAEYRDDNYAQRAGWQEIIVQPLAGVALLESTVPAKDQSHELRDYNRDLLQSPPTVSQASFRFEPQAASSQPWTAATPQTAPQAVQAGQDRFADLMTMPTTGPGFLFVALLAAFGLGAAHALTPGHGKTIVAAYLVGSRGTARHALFLGLTTTITHTAGVFALGLLTLFASQFILPEKLYPWLAVMSGGLVVMIGLSLLRGRWRGLVGPGRAQAGHDHSHHHDHDHDHNHDHHQHHHDHGHDHHHHDHEHGHSHLPPGADGAPITWRSLLALGVSGGLLPCPSALVVMLSAIALHRVAFGLLLIVAFSLGLAGVLTGIGIVLVHAGRLFNRLPGHAPLLRVLPVLSALFITLAGVGITLEALVQTGLLQI